MMMRLKNKSRVPPNGFQWRDPDTGVPVSGPNWSTLLSNVISERKGNQLPMVPEAEIEHQICSRITGASLGEYCVSNHPEMTMDGVSLRASDIARGTMTIGAFLLSGEALVAKEEAERRAAICAKCPFNVSFKSCGPFCEGLQQAVEKIVGHNATKYDANLHACAACKCDLRAKVWIPLEAIKRFEPQDINDALPSWCWGKN